jgi:hypothetical protein
MKSVLTFIREEKVDVDRLVNNGMVVNFEKYIETPVSKSVANGLLDVYDRTRKDGTWEALVEIVKGGAIGKLIELEKMVSSSWKVHCEELEHIIKLIHEIGAFFFNETLMIEKDMIEEEEEIIIEPKKPKKSLKEWGKKHLIPDWLKTTGPEITTVGDKLKTTKLKPSFNKHRKTVEKKNDLLG